MASFENNKSSTKLVIWDFDGVLCDSLIECITVTRVASFRMENPEIEINAGNLYATCNSDTISEHYEKMKGLRPFIVKGQDYLWQLYNLNKFTPEIKSFEAYQEIFRQIYNSKQDKIYEDMFYSSRKLVQNIMGKQYFTLFKAYTGAMYAFRASLNMNNNYICTARDQQGVELLFSNNSIKFPREKIYSKDFNGIKKNSGLSKSKQILDILNLEGGRNQPFLIVEDQIKAPEELKDACNDMSVVFAGYGYGMEADWLKAGLRDVKTIMSPSNLIYGIY